MMGTPSLEEVDARLRSLGANVIVSAEDERAIAHLVIRFPPASPVTSSAVGKRLARRRLGLIPITNRALRRTVLVLLTAAIVLALGIIVVAADTGWEASKPAMSISEQEAVADARHQLPNNGAGYTVVLTKLEPSSKHIDFKGPNGQGFGEDQVKECLVIPPLPRLPFLTPCRYYPVWVVALSSQTCDVVIAINALTGRFGGGGAASHGIAPAASSPVDTCVISPSRDATTPTWFQPMWG